MNIYGICFGALLGLLAFIYLEDGGGSDRKVANYTTVIQAAADTKDPVLAKEAEVARGELVKIQEKRAAVEADKIDRAVNPAKYEKQDKEELYELLTLAGAAFVILITLIMAQFMIRRAKPY